MGKTIKALMIIAIVAIVVIAGSMLYYFVFFQPGIQRQNLALQQTKYEFDQKQKQENKQALEAGLKKAKEDYATALNDFKNKNNKSSLTQSEAEFFWKMYQDTIANLYKQYGN
jgi:uncharacterized protein HemX